MIDFEKNYSCSIGILETEMRSGSFKNVTIYSFTNHIYLITYISSSSSSSSSCRAGSTDIPDPLSPLLPIVHRPRQVFRTTSRIPT